MLKRRRPLQGKSRDSSHFFRKYKGKSVKCNQEQKQQLLKLKKLKDVKKKSLVSRRSFLQRIRKVIFISRISVFRSFWWAFTRARVIDFCLSCAWNERYSTQVGCFTFEMDVIFLFVLYQPNKFFSRIAFMADADISALRSSRARVKICYFICLSGVRYHSWYRC